MIIILIDGLKLIMNFGVLKNSLKIIIKVWKNNNLDTNFLTLYSVNDSNFKIGDKMLNE